MSGHRGQAHLLALDADLLLRHGRREVPAALRVDRDQVDFVTRRIERAEDRGGGGDRDFVLDRATSEQQTDP